MKKRQQHKPLERHKSNCNDLASQSSWTCFYQTNFKNAGEITKKEKLMLHAWAYKLEQPWWRTTERHTK